MAIRKHRAGELVIEQTRDFARVRAMLARGGLMTDGIEWPAACYWSRTSATTPSE